MTRNANNPVNKIDLHGLQVKQAELIVTELLEKCKSEGFDTAVRENRLCANLSLGGDPRKRIA